MDILANWRPQPGDRIETIISKDASCETVYMNSESMITCTVNNMFLQESSIWKPWPHQIIDWLSIQKGYNRLIVLQKLTEFARTRTELDFDTLCIEFLKEIEREKQIAFAPSSKTTEKNT